MKTAQDEGLEHSWHRTRTGNTAVNAAGVNHKNSQKSDFEAFLILI